MRIFDSFFKKRNIILSKDMIDQKILLDKCKNNISDLEKDLVLKKLEEKKLRYDLLKLCKHEAMHYPKKKYESDNYSDYIAKCDICQGEVFDKNRALNYLSNLNDMLSRYPKVLEMLKILNEEKAYNNITMDKVFSLMQDIIELKNIISTIDQDKYNEIISEKCKN